MGIFGQKAKKAGIYPFFGKKGLFGALEGLM